MRTYTRALVPGACCFFTVNLAERAGNNLLVTHIAELRAAFRSVQQAHPFVMDAVVVMPEHLHCLWTLPEDDSRFPMRWQLIKARFSASLPRGEAISPSRQRRGERGIWQRRYWEHLIRNQADYDRHVDYIHYNPVKHGHVVSPGQWPYSSFHQWVKNGMLEPDWQPDEETIKANKE